MWHYNYDYLCHAIRQKEWEDHKYIDKIKTKKGGYRYIYEVPKGKQTVKTAIKTKNKNISSEKIGRSASVLAKTRFSLLKTAGIYTIDLKADEKLKKSLNYLKKQNDKATLDKYDDWLDHSEIFEGAKAYFYDLYDFYGLDPEKSWKKELKNMREVLRDYYGLMPLALNKYEDYEILELYMLAVMQSSGYDIEKTSLSHYLQNLGIIDESKLPGKTFNDLKKTGPVNDDLDMEYINHDNLDEMALTKWKGYPKEAGVGYTSNCAYCTLAYELRQRGYDVEASSVSMNTANTLDTIENWYEGGTAVPTSVDKNTMEKIMLSDTDKNKDARGQFLVYWYGGGGHSMVYEVINGDVQIRDCQTNEKYSFDNWYKLYGPYITAGYCIRTDNKKIKESALIGVKNRAD